MTNVSTRLRKRATSVTRPVTAVTPAATDKAAKSIENEASSFANTLLAIRIRPHGSKFAKSFRIAADDSGFRSGRHSMRPELMTNAGETIGYLKVDHGKESFGGLSLVECLIDPETCGLERHAGTRFVNVCLHFAERIEGVLCDADDKPLSHESRNALSASIDGAIDVRLKARTARLFQEAAVLPDGSRKIFEHLSFASTRQSVRGVFIERNCFDVEPELYATGHAKGVRMAKEFFAHIKAHRKPEVSTRLLLQDLFRVDDGAGWCRQTRSSVAEGFIEILCAALEESARVGVLNPKWIDGRAASYDKLVDEERGEYDSRRLAFIERMRAGRIAKQALREGGAA